MKSLKVYLDPAGRLKKDQIHVWRAQTTGNWSFGDTSFLSGQNNGQTNITLSITFPI